MPRSIIRRRQFVRLNGTDNAITFASYTPPTAAFSVAFWFRPRTGNGANARIVDWQDAGPASGFTLTMSVANRPQIAFNAETSGGASIIQINTTQMKLGEWNHVVAAYEVNLAKFFVNGVQQEATDTSVTVVAPAAAFVIGRRATGATNFCRGDIYDFMVFPRVLTTTEISNLYKANTIPTTPDVYLKMDERSGTSLADSSGNGRTGTLAGTALYGTEPTERILAPTFNKAVNFSAATSIVAVTDNATIRPDTTQICLRHLVQHLS